MLSQLVFQVVPVRGLDVVGIVGKESKRSNESRQLHHVFDLDGIAPYYRRMVRLHGLQHHVVQLAGLDSFLLVVIYVQRYFNSLENPCFFRCGNKNYRHVRKRRDTFFQRFFIVACGIGFFFHQVPFVDQ